MEELIPVNILVGDRNYRVKIKPADEENLRKTIKLVNNKLVEFKTNFAGKDMQDYVAMVLIWFATEKGNSPLSEQEESNLDNKLEALEKMLDAAD